MTKKSRLTNLLLTNSDKIFTDDMINLLGNKNFHSIVSGGLTNKIVFDTVTKVVKSQDYRLPYAVNNILAGNLQSAKELPIPKDLLKEYIEAQNKEAVLESIKAKCELLGYQCASDWETTIKADWAPFYA